jgi:hypothetical protein
MWLVGTAKQYPMNAMHELAKMASAKVLVVNLRCPYQANVMKTFYSMSRIAGATKGVRV